MNQKASDKQISCCPCVVVSLALLGLSLPGFPATIHNIIVDQIGYRPADAKVVVFCDPQSGQYSSLSAFDPGSTFEIKRVSDNSTAFSGTITAWNNGATDASSGDKAWHGDFSSFTIPGTYYVSVPGGTNPSSSSYPFDIQEDVYNGALRAASKFYYFQQCGIDLTASYGGLWTHPRCHCGTGQDLLAQLHNNAPAGSARDVHGGWHDAGDYGKYVEWTFTVLWELMHAVEWHPEAFGDNTSVPGSGNGVPDLLDEVRYELDWLLRMQFSDGSVSGKVQSIADEPIGPPDQETLVRYYAQASTGATAAGAAAFALGARLFTAYNGAYPGYADSLENAAVAAWSFLTAHPGQIQYNNTGFPGNGSNSNLGKERQLRVAAAAELFALTGETAYRTYFDANYNNADTRDPDASGVQPILDNHFDGNGSTTVIQEGMVSYCLAAGATASVVSNIKTALKNGIDWALVANADKDPYHAFLYGYWWGSNQAKTSWGNMAIWGVKLNVDPARTALYTSLAQNYLHYMHGCNPLNIVYLTNTGSKGADAGADKPVMNVWHLWFRDGHPQYDGDSSTYGPAPGIIPGGPNSGYSGSVTPPKGEPPMKSFVDWNGQWPQNSWEVTEPAIYYNSPYVHLASAFAGTAASRVISNKFSRQIDRFVTVTANDIHLNSSLIDNAVIELWSMNGCRVWSRSFHQGSKNGVVIDWKKAGIAPGAYLLRIAMVGDEKTIPVAIRR